MKSAIFTVALLAPLLGGCVGVLFDGALAEAGIGAAGEAGLAEGLGAEGASARLLVSDDVAVSLRGVRFSAATRGPLSQAFDYWTANGTSAGEIGISRSGVLSARGYTLGRLSPKSGVVYSGSGVRLGLVSRDGVLSEYLADGRTRPIGLMRGFVATRPTPVWSSAARASRIGFVPANGVVRITRMADGGFYVVLESGQKGWIADADLTSVALLALAQVTAICRHHDGIMVTKDNRQVKFTDCRADRRGFSLHTARGVLALQRSAAAYFMYGDIVSPHAALQRRRMSNVLRTTGVMYPPPEDYTIISTGDEPSPPSHAADERIIL